MPDGTSPLSDFTAQSSKALSPFYDNGFQQYVDQIVKSGGNRDQWIRKVSLIVSTAQGEGIDLSNMRIVFHQTKETNSTPNLLSARIYNLSQATINRLITSTATVNAGITGPVVPSFDPAHPAPTVRILDRVNTRSDTVVLPDLPDVSVTAPAPSAASGPFIHIRLSAGYQHGRFGVIFDGTIFQYVLGKETPVDTYLDIIAGDFDIPINYATINKSFPAGSTLQDRVNALVDSMVKEGAQKGSVDLGQAGNTKSDRGVVLFGMVKDRLREITGMVNADWYIDNGKITILHREDYLQGTAAYLSPKTGLIGMPQVTPQGINIKCLLNPGLQLGGVVKVDSEVISGVPFLPGADLTRNASGQLVPLSQNQSQLAQGVFAGRAGQVLGPQLALSTYTAPTSPVGQYKIFQLIHSGDTRGNSYYSDMVGLALDSNGKVITVPSDIFTRVTVKDSLGPGVLRAQGG